MKQAGIGAPAVIVIGGVAGDDVRREWFAGPLLGRRIVVTRARAQAGALSQRLRGLGAEVIELPTIRIRPLESPRDHRGLRGHRELPDARPHQRQWRRLPLRPPRQTAAATPVRSIRPARSSRSARRPRSASPRRGLRADIVPGRYVAEGILDALADRDLSGVPVLVARAAEARPDLVDGLRHRGAAVDEVLLYATEVEDPPRGRVEAALDADVITFTASSTVRNFAGLLTPLEIDRLAARVITIGPITSATAREAGLTVVGEATPHTIPALVDAVVADAADH